MKHKQDYNIYKQEDKAHARPPLSCPWGRMENAPRGIPRAGRPAPRRNLVMKSIPKPQLTHVHRCTCAVSLVPARFL